MEDVPHHHDLGLRKRILEETAGVKCHSGREAVGGYIILENRTDFGQIEADARNMRMRHCDLHNQIPLGSADIRSSLIIVPGKLARDSAVRSVAESGHRLEKPLQSFGVGVERCKETGPPALRLVLQFSCSQSGGQIVPKGIKTEVGHFEYSADVGGLSLIQEEIG